MISDMILPDRQVTSPSQKLSQVFSVKKRKSGLDQRGVRRRIEPNAMGRLSLKI
jgi:hypothetical protein